VMGTGGSFPEGKAARAWSWQLNASCVELSNGGTIPPPPHTSSWLTGTALCLENGDGK
jgi:hypothetical protein